MSLYQIYQHNHQNWFRVIVFTNVETLIETLSVKVGDTVGEHGRKTKIS